MQLARKASLCTALAALAYAVMIDTAGAQAVQGAPDRGASPPPIPSYARATNEQQRGPAGSSADSQIATKKDAPQGQLAASDSPSVSTPSKTVSGQSRPNATNQDQCFILGSRSFAIPFSVSDQGIRPKQVLLFVATEEGEQWRQIDQKPPQSPVKQFQFVAQSDGRYQFATRTIDVQGKPHPDGQIQPQLCVYVDTTEPAVELTADSDADGRVTVSWTITDATPLTQVLLRYATDTSPQWKVLPTERANASGSVEFSPESEWEQIQIQCLAVDTPGNRSVALKPLRRPRVAQAPGEQFAGNAAGQVEATARPYRIDAQRSLDALAVSNPVIQLDRRRTRNDESIAHAQGYAPATPGTRPALGAFRGASPSINPPAANRWAAPHPPATSRFPNTNAPTDPRRGLHANAAGGVLPQGIRTDRANQPAVSARVDAQSNQPAGTVASPGSNRSTAGAIQSQPSDVQPQQIAAGGQPLVVYPSERPTLAPSGLPLPQLGSTNRLRTTGPQSGARPQFAAQSSRGSTGHTQESRSSTGSIESSVESLPLPPGMRDIQGGRLSPAANVPRGNAPTPAPTGSSTPAPTGASSTFEIDLNSPGQTRASAERSNTGGVSAGDSTRRPQAANSLPNRSAPSDVAASAAPSLPKTPAEAMRPIAPIRPDATANDAAVTNGRNSSTSSPSTNAPKQATGSATPDATAYQSRRIETDPREVMSRAPVRYSNSKRFSLDYELEAVGNRGIESIELYGSVDYGKTWQLWGQDPDRRSPFDIEVKDEGVFGFRIVVVGQNGLASPRPLAGEVPDIIVIVDEQAPRVRITGAQYGEGDRTGSLVIQYEVADANLRSRPIALSFSDRVDGPWTTIAAGLRNDGDYVWPADPQLPRRLYLRIDATDEAGNVGSYILDQPIDAQGLAPRARIRGFQPLSEMSPPAVDQQTAEVPKPFFEQNRR